MTRHEPGGLAEYALVTALLVLLGTLVLIAFGDAVSELGL
jgi:hypothetical protein